jgi:amidophosphoribosyltransferase
MQYYRPCRPLVLGQRDTQDGPEYCVASEDCAFGPIGYRRVRDVRPGEMIIISPEVRGREAHLIA